MNKSIGWIFMNDNRNLDWMYWLLLEICKAEGMDVGRPWLRKRKIKRL